jgi:hypothetical protein
MLLAPLGSVKILFVFLVLQTFGVYRGVGHFSSLVPVELDGLGGALVQ